MLWNHASETTFGPSCKMESDFFSVLRRVYVAYLQEYMNVARKEKKAPDQNRAWDLVKQIAGTVG
jgi:hypothetical protein